MMELEERQEAFCVEYIRDLNATQAVLRAGYSPNGARVTGSRLLSNPNVRARIDQLKAERAEREKIGETDILNYLKNAITFNPLKIVDEDGRLLPISKIPLEYRALIQKIKMGKQGTEITFFSKEKAIELLSRHLGILHDKLKVEHTYTDLTDDELSAELERKRKEAGK